MDTFLQFFLTLHTSSYPSQSDSIGPYVGFVGLAFWYCLTPGGVVWSGLREVGLQEVLQIVMVMTMVMKLG